MYPPKPPRPPPSHSTPPEDREAILTALKLVDTRVAKVESRITHADALAQSVAALRQSFDTLSDRVSDMLVRDIEQQRKIGELAERMQVIGARAGGDVGDRSSRPTEATCRAPPGPRSRAARLVATPIRCPPPSTRQGKQTALPGVSRTGDSG